MIYLYAITDRPKIPVPAEPGLEGALIESIPYRRIAAVVSPLSTGTVRVSPGETNLWRHEAVVEALMVDRAVLPVRFGTVLANGTTVQAALTEHNADFVAALKHVCGRVELGLRVLWEDNEGWASAANHQAIGKRSRQRTVSDGRSYLLARLEEDRRFQAWRQRAELLATELHAHLSRLAAESTKQVLVTPRLLLTAAYLVERDRVAAFQQEVKALSATYPTLRLLCTGPWPPYSFVTAEVPTAEKAEGKDAHA